MRCCELRVAAVGVRKGNGSGSSLLRVSGHKSSTRKWSEVGLGELQVHTNRDNSEAAVDLKGVSTSWHEASPTGDIVYKRFQLCAAVSTKDRPAKMLVAKACD